MRVTQAEAARQLGLNKSTVCRYVAANPALLDAEGRVDVDELRAHRGMTVDPALQTRGPGAPGGAEAARSRAGAGDGDPRARKIMADGWAAELDLAERLGRTLDRSDVEMAVAEAGEALRSRASHMARDRAEALAAIDDVREMERALDDLLRELLEAGAAHLAALADQAEGTADAA